MAIQPFKLDIPQTTFDDLQVRLSRTLWPDQVVGEGWDYGTNLDYLKELTDYWQHQFDWRGRRIFVAWRRWPGLDYRLESR